MVSVNVKLRVSFSTAALRQRLHGTYDASDHLIADFVRRNRLPHWVTHRFFFDWWPRSTGWPVDYSATIQGVWQEEVCVLVLLCRSWHKRVRSVCRYCTLWQVVPVLYGCCMGRGMTVCTPCGTGSRQTAWRSSDLFSILEEPVAAWRCQRRLGHGGSCTAWWVWQLFCYRVVPKELLMFLGSLYKEVAKPTSGKLVYRFERHTARKKSSFEKHCVLDLEWWMLSQKPSGS